jgi:GNAT superfamily N-acetyltransferase
MQNPLNMHYTRHQMVEIERNAENKRLANAIRAAARRHADSGLARKVAANLEGRIIYYGRAAGLNYRADRNAAWLSTGIHFPSVFLNLVWRKRIGRDAQDIAQTLEAVDAAHHPVFWAAHSREEAERLEPALTQHGLNPVEVTWGMGRDLDGMPRVQSSLRNLSVARVDNPGRLADFVRVLASDRPADTATLERWLDVETRLGFDARQPWQRYIGLLNGEPVTTAAVYQTHNTAGVYHVQTVESARGRGLGTYMTSYALKAARERGARTGVLIATGMGHDIYRRLGFEDCAELHLYANVN